MAAVEFPVMAAFPFDGQLDAFLFDNLPNPLDLSDYMLFDDGPVECPAPTGQPEEGLAVAPTIAAADTDSGSGSNRSGGKLQEAVMGEGSRVAFRTRSEVELLDDGFKWRKYGKKSVKNSPNPRNYYRCSTDGCTVKKRVERDREDPSYVITTYEGIHNHASPGMVYYATQDSVSGRFVVSGCHALPPSS